MPGILSIFYGDEIGMTGYGNIINRSPFDLTKADKELLAFFRKLGDARKREQFLREADLKMLEITDKHIMFERKGEDASALVAVNRTGEESRIILPSNFDSYDRVYSLNDSNEKKINPYGGITLVKERKRTRH